MGRVSDAKEKLLSVAFDLIHEHSYSTVSVDSICARAKVNKGSFYYYFKTKSDLVAAAYEENWRVKESDYERIFSTENPPLKRLSLWCDHVRATQKARYAKYKHACGCPYASVGGELATQDKKIRRKAQDFVGRTVRYLTGAIADAMLAGEVEPGDADLKAKLVHAFMIGLLLRAKIYNDLKILNHADEAVLALAGAKIGADKGV